MQDLLGEAPVHLKGREPRVGRGRFQDVIQVKLTCEGSQGRKIGEEEPETTALYVYSIFNFPFNICRIIMMSPPSFLIVLMWIFSLLFPHQSISLSF